jgi:uncharacterized protein YggE
MKTIVTALLVTGFASATAASDLPGFPFVYARGVAKTKVKPDMCVVDFRVRVRDRTSTDAMKAVESRSAKALAVLFEHGVKREDLKGFEIQKHAVHEWDEDEKAKLTGYEIARNIQFTLRDLTQYEPMVSILLKMENVVDIYTNFDRTDREDIESRLLADAVSKARAKAELMAKGSGQRIVKLRAISQHGFENIAESFGVGDKDKYHWMADMSQPPEKELLFVPSTVEFQDAVSVIYELTEQK